jgi:hypothetical protein
LTDAIDELIKLLILEILKLNSELLFLHLLIIYHKSSFEGFSPCSSS